MYDEKGKPVERRGRKVIGPFLYIWNGSLTAIIRRWIFKNQFLKNGGKEMIKSRMLVSMLVIALAAALIGGATMAWFTDEDTAGETTFTAGTLIVDVSDGLTEFHGLLEEGSKHGNMNPGDVYDEIVIEIVNDGTKNFAWFGDWTATVLDGTKSDALLDAIYIKTMKMEFLRPDATEWETADQFITDGVGSGAYPGWYNTLAAEGPFPVVSLRSWIDNNGMGTTPFEHMGALRPGYKYKLTVQFGFHHLADNDYQGDVASPIELGFAVEAHQVNLDALNAFQPGFGTNHHAWLMAQIAKQ